MNAMKILFTTSRRRCAGQRFLKSTTGVRKIAQRLDYGLTAVLNPGCTFVRYTTYPLSYSVSADCLARWICCTWYIYQKYNGGVEETAVVVRLLDSGFSPRVVTPVITAAPCGSFGLQAVICVFMLTTGDVYHAFRCVSQTFYFLFGERGKKASKWSRRDSNPGWLYFC